MEKITKYPKELEVAKELAVNSGKKIMGIYGSKEFSTRMKSDNSPLTEADVEANRIIVSGLRKEFPEDAILTEEEKDDKSRIGKDRVWVVDPLDGTKEFIARNGEFTVNIALVENRKAVLGVVFVPARNEMYFASKGNGAFFEKNGKMEKIAVSDRAEFGEMVLVKSRSHASEKLMSIIEEAGFKEIKTAGSSLKGCLVAKGKADVYIRLGPVNEWDICAMSSIISESGGKITNLKGETLKFNSENTLIKGFIASNGRAHEKLIEMVK